jgi:Zn-finger nucleic acid-binding protein
MGGKAVDGKRIPKDIYLKICNLIIDYLKKEYQITAKCPKVLTSKLDFGDIDILIQKSDHFNPSNYNPTKDPFFNSKRVSINNYVISFEYQEYQVDFLFFSPQEYEMACFVYDFGDLKMFLGVIFKVVHIKTISTGMEIVVNYSDTEHDRLILTTDPTEILTFAGLDIPTYNNGFHCVDDICDWLYGSKLLRIAYAKKLFDNKQNNGRENKRALERRTYVELKQKFANRVESEYIDHEYLNSTFDRAISFFGKALEVDEMKKSTDWYFYTEKGSTLN